MYGLGVVGFVIVVGIGLCGVFFCGLLVVCIIGILIVVLVVMSKFFNVVCLVISVFLDKYVFLFVDLVCLCLFLCCLV